MLLLKMNEMQCVNAETDSTVRTDVSEKRTRKPTFKGIMIMIERLQKERRDNFAQASKLKTKIKTLLVSKENVSAVQHNLKRFKQLCQKASELHTTLLTQFSLPEEDQRKQETWFQSKRSNSDVFVEVISTWLKENGISHDDDGDENDVDENDDDADQNDEGDDDVDKYAKSECQDDVNPEDSVSNVPSKRSSRRSHSKAEKAALMEKAAALQRRHDLEAQEEKLRQESKKLTVLGKLLGKCSELSYQLLYIKLSFTTPKLPPREMYQVKLQQHGKSSLTTSELFIYLFIYFLEQLHSKSKLSQ